MFNSLQPNTRPSTSQLAICIDGLCVQSSEMFFLFGPELTVSRGCMASQLTTWILALVERGRKEEVKPGARGGVENKDRMDSRMRLGGRTSTREQLSLLL